jgi:adenosine deaminase
LHAHLSGSISRHCLHRIWATRAAADHAFTLQDPLHAIPADKVDYDLDT